MFVDFILSYILFLDKLGCASPSHPNKQIALCFPSCISTAPNKGAVLIQKYIILNLLLLQEIQHQLDKLHSHHFYHFLVEQIEIDDKQPSPQVYRQT